MKYVANILLIGLIGLLVYMLVNSIKEPIAFGDAKSMRKDAVSAKLQQVRSAQEIYRSIKGEFAGDFDQLASVLKNDSIPFVKRLPDPAFPDQDDKFITDTTFTPAIDSIVAMGINPDSLRFIPFTDGASFYIKSDTVEYQSTNVNVVEVGTTWGTFMGQYADRRFAKYDKTYDPDKPFKFGDMSSPSLAGNWE